MMSKKSSLETLASQGKVIPNLYSGPCPYPCTDTRCKAYANGYCGPVDTIALINTIKSDPDFQTIANALNTYYSIFVNENINMSTYDLTNNALFLSTTGSTQAQLNTLVQNIKVAGQRLVVRYGFNSSQCIACTASFTTENAAFDSTITNFQRSLSSFASFISQSLGIGNGSNSITTNMLAAPCCGFWFYACCSLAAETIEAFPIYLAACGYCFHVECCKVS